MLFSPTCSNCSSLTCSRAGGHPLCLRCLTMEMWRPKLRWTEQHSSQIRTPRLMLVQPGSGRDTQVRDGKMSYIVKKIVISIHTIHSLLNTILKDFNFTSCNANKSSCFPPGFFSSVAKRSTAAASPLNQWESVYYDT